MPTPEDFNPENSRICWPAILAVFAVQMIALITLSIAVANHSDFATASSKGFRAGLNVDDKSDVPKGPTRSSCRADIGEEHGGLFKAGTPSGASFCP
jgi:hypothetical protein